MSFECRVCQHDRYRQIVVLRPKGPYQTPFFACMKCGVMFTDAEAFSATPLKKVTNVVARKSAGKAS
jgi:hypothetical protein